MQRSGRRTAGRQPFSSRRVRKKLVGMFVGHSRGFGFVRRGDEGDIFIPGRFVGEALHGDVVEVSFQEGGRYGRAWGMVQRVVEPRREPVAGLFRGEMVVPRDPRLTAWIKVAAHDTAGAESGMMVAVEITRRTPQGIYGRIVEILGKQEDPVIESRLILHTHGFNEEFPTEVREEAAGIVGRKGSLMSLAGREDLRGLFTITIDPASARDFDDALSLERRGSGWRLWISIADVSHYVLSGSDIDEEAYARATSVYLPDRAVHMLPEELAADLCSLQPGVDRLALTVEIDFDREGRRVGARLFPAVIRSDARLSYDEVEAMREDRSAGEEKGLRLVIAAMCELMELRYARRRGRGAIDLNVPEAEVVLDSAGEVETILRREQTWSHRLVEEFMLAANEVVAEFLTAKRSPMLYRIHEPPAPSEVEKLAEMLAPLGFRLFGRNTDPLNIKPADFQRVIDQAVGSPYEVMVKTLCLRAMMQARYSAELAGHFGLAIDRYCHFTSPIRRYPDLIVHRLLKHFMSGSPVLSLDKPGGPASPSHLARLQTAPEPLPEAAAHCSERERAAMEVEREITAYYSARWMVRHLGEEFEGTVSSVTRWGIFVELKEAYVEGMVPAELIDERVEFREEELALYTWPRGECYRIGDSVRVRALAADAEQRKITFGLADGREEKASFGRSRGGRGKRGRASGRRG